MSDCLKLKKSNCVNCYKCIRHCPVKSIRFSGNQAHIVGNECILCGQCFVVCPQDAKEIVDSTEKVKILLSDDAPVIASIAPSFIANYHGVGIESIRDALKKLGFYDAEETAIGATIVKKEYDRMLKEDNRNVLISSCCHSINLLIQKHFPDLLSYLADIVSPMQAHSIDIKKRYPGAKTVFIGPCVAKKDEADHYGDIVDAVLTFEELTQWLKNEGIELEEKCDSEDFSKARIFPTTGGILKSMDLDASDYNYLALDGVENCISALEDIRVGNLKNCFIEMSACVGSCIGGPVMEKYNRFPIRDYIAVDN
ncbi:MAG: [Fe-Fe] hydrogenase large subunit C-terminal domain-containing protein, partial [Ruminococcus sp.]